MFRTRLATGLAATLIAVVTALPATTTPAHADLFHTPGVGDWTRPVSTKSWPTEQDCILWTCPARYQRYERLRDALFHPSTRVWAAKYLVAQVGISGAAFDPLERKLTSSGQRCWLGTLWVLQHLAIDMYRYDNGIYATKAWAVPLLDAASSIGKFGALGTRVYDIVLAETGSKKKARESRDRFNQDLGVTYSAVLAVGIGVAESGTRNNWKAKVMLQTERACS